MSMAEPWAIAGGQGSGKSVGTGSWVVSLGDSQWAQGGGPGQLGFTK